MQPHSSQHLKFTKRFDLRIFYCNVLLTCLSFSISGNFSDQRRTLTTQTNSSLEQVQDLPQ